MVVSDESLLAGDETDAAQSTTAVAQKHASSGELSMTSSVALLTPEGMDILESYSGTLGMYET